MYSKDCLVRPYRFTLGRECGSFREISVTRLGDLIHFGQLFKACDNNYFAQIAYIFCKGFKNFHFSCEIILGNFYIHLATFTGCYAGDEGLYLPKW